MLTLTSRKGWGRLRQWRLHYYMGRMVVSYTLTPLEAWMPPTFFVWRPRFIPSGGSTDAS